MCVSVSIQMIRRWQCSLWVAGCHSSWFPCLSFPSLFADHIHFMLCEIQTVNTSVLLLSLYDIYVHGISVLPVPADATEYKPKWILQCWPYLFIYILSGAGQINQFSCLLFHIGLLCANMAYLIHSVNQKMILLWNVISIGMLFFHMMPCENLIQIKDFACQYYLCCELSQSYRC